MRNRHVKVPAFVIIVCTPLVCTLLVVVRAMVVMMTRMSEIVLDRIPLWTHMHVWMHVHMWIETVGI